MHLTRRTDYGLRLLMLLAVEGPGPLGLPDAARRLEVSANHLAKVAQALVRAQLLESVRGRRGGLVMPEATREVTVATIVRALEPMPIAECFSDEGACTLVSACKLRDVLADARDAFLATLEQHTLGDLVARRKAPLLRLTNAGDHSS